MGRWHTKARRIADREGNGSMPTRIRRFKMVGGPNWVDADLDEHESGEERADERNEGCEQDSSPLGCSCLGLGSILTGARSLRIDVGSGVWGGSLFAVILPIQKCLWSILRRVAGEGLPGARARSATKSTYLDVPR
jgi:hypothetical protein